MKTMKTKRKMKNENNLITALKNYIVSLKNEILFLKKEM